jgi:hypothetical protein
VASPDSGSAPAKDAYPGAGQGPDEGPSGNGPSGPSSDGGSARPDHAGPTLVDGGAPDAAGGPTGQDAGSAGTDGPPVSPPAPDFSAAGAPCRVAADCPLPGMRCDDEVNFGSAYGYCWKSCDDDTDCPGGSSCYLDLNGNRCLSDCASDADCRSGQSCTTKPSEWGPMYFCLPFCTSDADCPTAGQCDLYTGLCGGTSTWQKANGSPCESHVECRGDVCDIDGACTSPCDLARGAACPDGRTCQAGGGGPSMGLCK